jgi:hypothetical protein
MSLSLSSLEMEFLDINLTKDSSVLLHAIHTPFYDGKMRVGNSSLRRLEFMLRNLD